MERFSLKKGLLQGKNQYRIRVGGWRMGIEYTPPADEQVAATIVITILNRGDVYKKFPQK